MCGVGSQCRSLQASNARATEWQNGVRTAVGSTAVAVPRIHTAEHDVLVTCDRQRPPRLLRVHIEQCRLVTQCCGCRCCCCGLLQHDCSYSVARVVTFEWPVPAAQWCARALGQLPVAGWQLTVWAPCGGMSSRPCQHLEAHAQTHTSQHQTGTSRSHQPSSVAAKSISSVTQVGPRDSWRVEPCIAEWRAGLLIQHPAWGRAPCRLSVWWLTYQTASMPGMRVHAA